MEFDEKKGYLVLDIETTGLDYIKDDILSLSIFDPKNNKIFQKYFPLAKRKRILNSKIHGITPKFLKGANHFSQSDIDYLIKDFNITQKVILTFGTFDQKFLENYFLYFHLDGFKNFSFFNIQDFVITSRYSDGLYTKDNLCKAFGIDNITEKHSSSNDCVLEWELFCKMNKQPIFIYHDNIYKFSPDYIIPASVLNSHPKYKNFIKDYPSIKIDYEEIYSYEIVLDRNYYPDIYFWGVLIDRYIPKAISAVEQNNDTFIDNNFSKLIKLCELADPDEIDPKISIDDNNLIHIENEYFHKFEKEVNDSFLAIKNKLSPVFDFIKKEIFNNKPIKSQELVINKELNSFAICDLSNEDAVLEIKGNINSYIKYHSNQFFLESNNRPVYILKIGFMGNKLKIQIGEIIFDFSKKRRTSLEIIHKIRGWRNKHDNDDIVDYSFYDTKSHYICSNTLGIDIITVNKYWDLSDPSINFSDEVLSKTISYYRTKEKNKIKVVDTESTLILSLELLSIARKFNT